MLTALDSADISGLKLCAPALAKWEGAGPCTSLHRDYIALRCQQAAAFAAAVRGALQQQQVCDAAVD